MKKILFLMMAMFACWQVNASEFSDINYIEKYGRLKLVGNQLSDANGKAVQLRGWSTFGLQWNVSCYTKQAFQTMKDWGANIVRLAMYVQEGGYANDPNGIKAKVKNMIDWTNDLGLYCLVDWHVLTPGNPNSGDYWNIAGSNQAPVDFFKDITSYVKSKNYIHVLYEICNEPNGCDWSDIKQYANKGVLSAIQNGDPGSIVIVGTPQWDQEITKAANDPITGYNNIHIMYAFHVYAATSAHLGYVNQMKTAAGKIPVFMSEWGISEAQGNGEISESNGDLVLAIADGDNAGKQKISWCFWNWGDKNESSSSLQNCASINETTLRRAGEYIITKLCGDKDCSTTVLTEGPFGGEAQTIPTREGGYFELAYYDLGGPGVAYVDGNGTDWEQENDCNNGYQYAGEGWDFRKGDCVDVSSCYGLSGNYDVYNLNTRENDEWMKYTVKVEKPGYYTMRYLATQGTGGGVMISVGSTNGENYGNALFDSDTEEEINAFYLQKFSTGKTAAWEDWGWQVPQDEDQNNLESTSVLFKEAGTFVMTIMFPTEGGDLGPFEFSFAKAYNGDGYPESTEVKDAAINTIYPIVSADEITVNADVEKMEVINLVGAVLSSSSENRINISNLASGTYLVRIYTADKNVVVKKFIKE